jgi:hypothetical protein
MVHAPSKRLQGKDLPLAHSVFDIGPLDHWPIPFGPVEALLQEWSTENRTQVLPPSRPRVTLDHWTIPWMDRRP